MAFCLVMPAVGRRRGKAGSTDVELVRVIVAERVVVQSDGESAKLGDGPHGVAIGTEPPGHGGEAAHGQNRRLGEESHAGPTHTATRVAELT